MASETESGIGNENNLRTLQGDSHYTIVVAAAGIIDELS